ncbi:hypothetical protein AB0I98_47205 [Streptomyces sp. NPDC050211]|uniref:hypothetical protein n=1 Tax=Streptomyces sp. NPDC050211 TaxID=3154932 RepID=UPI0034228576
MEITAIVVLVLVILVPSVARLVDSLAYWTRAQGRAKLIRAQGGQAREELEGGRERG